MEKTELSKDNNSQKNAIKENETGTWQNFVQIIIVHVIARREVFSMAHLKNTFNEIRSGRGFPASSRSGNVKIQIK